MEKNTITVAGAVIIGTALYASTSKIIKYLKYKQEIKLEATRCNMSDKEYYENVAHNSVKLVYEMINEFAPVGNKRHWTYRALAEELYLPKNKSQK